MTPIWQRSLQFPNTRMDAIYQSTETQSIVKSIQSKNMMDFLLVKLEVSIDPRAIDSENIKRLIHTIHSILTYSNMEVSIKPFIIPYKLRCSNSEQSGYPQPAFFYY